MDEEKMKGWTDAQRAAYQAAIAGLDIAQAAAVKVVEPTPEELIAELELERLQIEEETALRARDRADDVAYARACKQHGSGRVGRLRTREGSIIFRAMNGAEMDSHALRVDEVETDIDKMTVLREGFYDCVLHPDKAEARKLFDRYPKLWDHAFDAAATLNAGVAREVRGKG